MLDTGDIVRLLSNTIGSVEPFDTNTALRLKLLVDAIKGGADTQIESWAASDLFELVDPDGVVARFDRQYVRDERDKDRMLAVLGGVRNVLLLLPFVITLYALALAANAYNMLLDAQPAKASLPFFYLWQQGFNGNLPPLFIFGSLAIIDALILLFVFLLTLVTYVQSVMRAAQRDRSADQYEQAAQALRSDLVHVLAATSLYLARYKRSLTAGEDLERVVRRVDATSRRMEERFEGISSNFDSMTQNVTRRFDGMTQNVTRSFAALTQNAADKFDGTTRTLSADFDGMVKDLTEKYDGMSQQVIRRFGILTNQMQEQLVDGSKYLKELGNLTSGVVQTAEQIRQSADALKQTNSELVLSMHNLVAPTADLAQRQGELMDAATQSVTLLHYTVNTLADLARKQDRWGTDLRNILDTLDLTIERATQLTMKVGDFTGRQDAFLAQLQQEQQEQARLVTLLSEAIEKAGAER